VREEVPLTAVAEALVNVTTLVLPSECQPSLELHLEERPIDVLRDEIRTTPVVAQPDGEKAVIGEYAGDLLKVEGLLLAGIQLLLVKALEGCGHGKSLPDRCHAHHITRNQRVVVESS
jgi:hypothetical protein